MESSAIEFYHSKQETFNTKLKSVSQKIRLFAWYRLAAFILVFVPFAGWGWNGWLTFLPTLFFLVLFFFLVKKNIQFEKQKKKFEALKKITVDELLAILILTIWICSVKILFFNLSTALQL
jgi:hypothetical protein